MKFNSSKNGFQTLYKPSAPTLEWSYMSMYSKDTVKEASKDALIGLMMWYTQEEVEETALELVDDW